MDKYEIRMACLSMAIGDSSLSAGADAITERARKFEAFVWGGFQPIERPVTPLNTIDEATEAALKHLRDLIQNTANAERRKAMREALSTLERFRAEINQALEDMKV